MGDKDPVDQPFGDIPLFRELQRLLTSSSGPINLEIAGQAAGGVISQAGPESSPTPEAIRAFSEGVRSAEVMLAGYTRLSLDEPMQAETLTRRQWAEATLASWRWLLERLATRFTGEFGRVGEAMAPPAEGQGEGSPTAAMMGQVGPLLLGLQAGQLIGSLATESLSRYYIPIPRDDEGRLFVVHANAEKVARDYGFAPDDLWSWLAVHEAARHLVFVAVAWAQRYYRGLVTEVVDSIEIDMAGLERRLVELQSAGMEALQEGAASELLPVAHTERHALALGRVRSFVALLEGYSSHAAGVVLAEILEDSGRVDEAMARHRASSSDGQTALAGLLGISFDRALETSGATFCAAVTQLKGLGVLNRVWDAPDNLPSPEEIRDPFKWMERVAPD